MGDVADVFRNYPDAALTLRADGPPSFDGGRIILAGDPGSFRMLAAVLTAMAEAVEDPGHPASRHGWSLVLAPADVPQLRMGDAMLSLECVPGRTSPL